MEPAMVPATEPPERARKRAYKTLAPLAPSATSWITTPKELRLAAQTTMVVFGITFAALVATGMLALATAPQADLRFENLEQRVRGAYCLKVARRADYAVVYLNLGAPVQRLQLLLDMERPVPRGGEQIKVLSERMHKSTGMSCTPLTPPRPYELHCQDSVMVAVNGTTTQRLGQVSFTFQNDQAELGKGNVAALLGLDGTFALTLGTTYWMTTTDLCYAPHEPDSVATEESLAFSTDEATGALFVRGDDLASYPPTAATHFADTQCNSSLARVRLFPSAAFEEQRGWLSLSDRTLYEYDGAILEKRRRVVELGAACAATQPELAHVLDIYNSDCGLALQPCQDEPALTFRRLATSRMRIDLGFEGNGTLRAEETDALKRVPSLVTHEESLNSALGRLFVLLLTAAVVFLRGSQNAASSRYMLSHTLNIMRCREQFAPTRDPLRFTMRFGRLEVATDAVVSFTALLARVIVLFVSYAPLVADDNATTARLEIVGVAVSSLHLLLRYALHLDLNREAPLTKLGGPMSVVDCTSAVLLLFSDAPLLSADSSKFSSVGRILISILTSLAVFTRCAFSAATVSAMAVSATNGARKELTTHKMVLNIAVFLWMIQAMVSAGNAALLFVRPAAVAVVRSSPGPTEVFKYAIWAGLVAASLPTYTKVSLRALEEECTGDGTSTKAE
jgi:hypothetical protein